MKTVILSGGFGTRLGEETSIKPKPMVEIGGKPILWHIMKLYSNYGINEFVICLGYKGYIIKEYFANYFLHNSDVTIETQNNSLQIHNSTSEPWKISLIDTGINTMTGGRIKKIKNFIDDTFFLTYGDGLSDVNLSELLKFHKKNDSIATLTAVQPPGRFGILKINDTKVTSFFEKPAGDGSWINGGFFVLEPEIFDYIDGDNTVWEKEPLEKLANEKKLTAFKHTGFWHPLDTMRDKKILDNLWDSGNAPWKKWS